MGHHPYVLAGLQPYSFNELIGSEETVSRPYSSARHWLVKFKDEALDVIARTGEVIALVSARRGRQKSARSSHSHPATRLKLHADD